MSEHVDGEDEPCAVLVSRATMEFARASKGPVQHPLREAIAWIVRESFRRGYRHAHERRTMADRLKDKE
jgi:hypothetical protein